MDVAAVLARGPQLVLVDDLAHALPDGRSRADQVQTLLDAGIDVVTTINITNVASLRDTVAGIVGTAPTETVPDALIRSDQIELVDISPVALRRRLAHGHIYPPEAVDSAVANLFRPQVLGALRQLALLWLADRVEEQLDPAAPTRLADETADVRERIVVALGGEGGDLLVRRAARIAGRTGAQLLGIHVAAGGRTPGPDLEQQRALLIGLGGVYREVVGDDVAAALAAVARAEQATQVVLGARAKPRGTRRNQSVVHDLIGKLGQADIHVVTTAQTDLRPLPLALLRGRPRRGRRNSMLGWLLCFVGLPLLTIALSAAHRHVSVSSALLLDLCLVLAVAALAGLRAGFTASVLAFGLTNWFLTPPLHTLSVGDAEHSVALGVFVFVTVVVSLLVDRAARRSIDAQGARADAEALARSAATLVGSAEPLPLLLEQIRSTFGLASASVLERNGDSWWPTEMTGTPQLSDPSQGTSISLATNGSLQLVISANALRPEQLEVLRAFADQLAVAVESRRLRADAANADLLAEADAMRSSLLQAVSHDFRTPLATIKSSASGLLASGAAISPSDRNVLLTDIDNAADRLDRMVRNLLDLSRLQAGAVQLSLQAVALEDVVAAGLNGLPADGHRLVVDVSEELPLVLADAALLERAIANLASNALAWSPTETSVRVVAGRVGDVVDLRIVDRGPGIALEDRARATVPFQRLGDRSSDAGAGLGLAIAKGFIEAMGAELEMDDTPGGGLTVTILIPTADLEER